MALIWVLLILLMPPAFSAECAQGLTHARAMTAHFQHQVRQDGRLIETQEGTLAFRRPGLFRWWIQRPHEQILIINSKGLWLYDPALMQVIHDQPKDAALMALLLSGTQEALLKKYTLKQQGCWYTLTMKSQPTGHPIRLHVVGHTLSAVHFFDGLGLQHVLHLTHQRTDPHLSTALFENHLPPGVDIIEGEHHD